jgi:DHA3 family macrolide efflux protein-like MFS transporter
MMTDTSADPAVLAAMSGPSYHPGPRWQLRYFSIFGGQSLSLVGSALTQFVLMWWITSMTGSVAALAMAGVAALLPQALLAPLGGTLADRYSRRLLMIVTDLISALCMMVLIWLFASGGIALWHIYLAMFMRSAAQAFQMPAASASVAMLVPPDFLQRASGLSQMLMGVVTIAAAPLGALAMSLMPIGWALGIDVFTAIFGIVPLLIFAVPQHAMPHDERRGLWHEFKDGVALVWSDVGLRNLYGLLAVVVLLLMPLHTLVPLLIMTHFGGGAPKVAMLEGVAGIGMILGGVAASLFVPRRAMRRALGALITANLALMLTGLVPGHIFWLGMIFWAVGSVALVVGNSPMVAILQAVVPNHLQGRVFSLLSMVMGVGAPIGLAIATPVGEAIGVRWLFVVAGLLGALICIAGLFSRPLMRLDDRLPPPPTPEAPR